MNRYTVASIVVIILIVVYVGYVLKCSGNKCFAQTSQTEASLNFIFMNPKKIEQQIKNEEIVLLDVREDYEWEAGYIDGAIHISLGDLNTESTKDLPKDKPIYVYCQSGNRAGQAKKILDGLGFIKVTNIGGILEWLEKGGELVR